MSRLLIVSCLALGVAVAKPGVPRQAVPYDGVEPVPYDEVIPLTLQQSRAVQLLDAGTYRFSSPNYPNSYPNNERRSFTLQGSEGQQISISCSPFSLQLSFFCWRDFLSINNVRYCGSNDIPTITAT